MASSSFCPSSLLPFLYATEYSSSTKGTSRIFKSSFFLTNSLAGSRSMITASTLPCFNAWMASAPLLYFSTVAFSMSPAKISPVVPSCVPITFPTRSSALLISDEEPELHPVNANVMISNPITNILFFITVPFQKYFIKT